jgi:transposase
MKQKNKSKKKNCRKHCACMKEMKAENKKLQEEKQKLQIQLKELQDKYYRRRKKKKGKDEPAESTPKKKKGPPFGHKPWSRPTPENIDMIEPVVPEVCHCCGSGDLEPSGLPAEEHIQEDVVRPKRKVTKYVHEVYKCKGCGALVRSQGKDEMPGCPIGPQTKAIVNNLRYDIGIPQNKIKKIMEELFDMPFVQGSVVGFEQQLRRGGSELYSQIKTAMINAPSRYIDETGWYKDGHPIWLWCLCTKQLAFFHIDASRGGKVLKAFFTTKFTGIIISDFLRTYDAIEGKKQKCIPHALRNTVKLDLSYGSDDEVMMFCEQLKTILKYIMLLFKERKRIKDFLIQRADVVSQCKKLLSIELSNARVDGWRQRLLKHKDELSTCLFHPCSDSNNNFVERMLRPSVIMRKITFGNRTDKGTANHAVIMSLLQTIKLNGHDSKQIFSTLLTKPSTVTLNDILINKRPKGHQSIRSP